MSYLIRIKENTRNFNFIFTLDKDLEISSKFKFPPPRNHRYPIKSKIISGSEMIFPDKYMKEKQNSFKINQTRHDNIIKFEIQSTKSNDTKSKEKAINNRFVYAFNNNYKKRYQLGNPQDMDLLRKRHGYSINEVEKLKELLVMKKHIV